MYDRSQRIKNLTFALEAVSRINSCSYNVEIERLLEFELAKYKEEQAQSKKPEPTNTSTNLLEDEIPF